jgi:hypothetical protein
VLVRAAVVWLLLLFLAILNVTVRETVLNPQLGPEAGHILSTVLLSGLIVLVAWVAVPWIGPETSRLAFAVGVLWLGLTLAFEFGAGHWLFRRSWAELLADYNLASGRIWPLVLVATLLAPILAGKWRHLWS